jgi:hypothetical protein
MHTRLEQMTLGGGLVVLGRLVHASRIQNNDPTKRRAGCEWLVHPALLAQPRDGASLAGPKN